MFSNVYDVNEKICGYAISVAFFFILISTAVVNIGILISVITGLILISKERNYSEIFIKNKVNLSIVFLFLMLIISYVYSIANQEEAISLLKKYIKLLYIPICYYIFKIEWIRSKAINFFITGSTIILFLSYLKYSNIINPGDFARLSNIFGANFSSYYDKNLLGGVTVFQNSIIHGVVLSFYFFITFLKGKEENNSFYYILSFLSFYNILFMNISRTSYIIAILLILLIAYKYSNVKNYKKNFVIFIFITFILVIGNKSTIVERYDVSFNDIISIKSNYYKTSLGLRYIYADNGIKNIIIKPIFGHGLGSYKTTIKRYFEENNLDMDNYLTQNPHNEFISISTQTGLIGLSIFFAFLYFFIKNYFYTDIGKSVTIIIFVSSLFNSMFYDNVMGIFIILIISLAMQKNVLNAKVKKNVI